jgi:hypothetical protein
MGALLSLGPLVPTSSPIAKTNFCGVPPPPMVITTSASSSAVIPLRPWVNGEVSNATQSICPISPLTAILCSRSRRPQRMEQ